MKENGRDESYFLEYAMQSCFHEIEGKERDYIYSNHRGKRLLKAGYLALAGEEHPRKLYMKSLGHPYKEDPANIWYWPTEAGLSWWIARRAEQGESWLKRDAEYHFKNYGVEYIKGGAPNVGYLLRYFEGKGIDGQIELYVGRLEGMLVWVALRDGLLNFVSHRDYAGAPHNCEEYVTVALTLKGQQFFDSLPRLLLECA